MLVPNILDKNVRLVNIQFSFSNKRFVPPSVPQKSNETEEERVVRKSRAAGIQFIQPTEKCFVFDFAYTLMLAGYEMVDAFAKTRNTKPDGSGTDYQMVRFVFARHEHTKVSNAFIAIRDNLQADLYKMCREAMWRVRAFNNPYYLDDENSTERTVSINLEVREPLYLPDGQPVKARRKDEQGRPYGEPVTITWKHDLEIGLDEHIIRIVPPK